MKKGYVFYRREETEQDRHYNGLTPEQKETWKSEQVKTYKKGDAVKAVSGGALRGWYTYGYVTEVYERGVEFKPLGDGKCCFKIAAPGPVSGLCHVNEWEMREAEARFSHPSNKDW
jgi:hypothetical protein